MPTPSRPPRALRGILPLACCMLLAGCGGKLDGQGQGDGAQASAGEAATLRAAPPFSLTNDDGSTVSLDELLAGGKPAVLVFYRGHW